MSSISDFYAGKSIFITGATGFVGKVLVEKLLRECPELKCIYLLIRAKNSQGTSDRFSFLKESQLFDKLRMKQPDFCTKLIPIKGDLTSPELGISSEDKSLLMENVNIIFHSAATVKFDEPLKYAFVHVSTAYSCCENGSIEELVYDPPYSANHLTEAISWMPDALLKDITPALLQNKPNTYILTKHLAEHLVITEGKDLPMAIVRPAIVGAVWKDPIPQHSTMTRDYARRRFSIWLALLIIHVSRTHAYIRDPIALYFTMGCPLKVPVVSPDYLLVPPRLKRVMAFPFPFKFKDYSSAH
ncbi:hypothetical protein FSP39_024069 [Pinctada imbricata]|uniref:Fatty acyl-CoA reductase n=1 Tax=Pinctada imbricata TaxID=66713 RepID=A0AA89BYA0_PINIB|nr:hypothetical protein FSP39_024069 [Pinctada imbricata]